MATPTSTKGKRPLGTQATAQLSKNELERITEVFKIYETGLREATIYPKVRLSFYIKKLKLSILKLPLKKVATRGTISNITSH